MALDKHPDDLTTQILYLRLMVSSHKAKATELAHTSSSSPIAVNGRCWYLNAILESQEGDFAAARAHLELAISLNPGYSQSHAELGNILARADELLVAKEHLEKAIALGDTDPEVQFQLAMVLKRLGDSAQAQQKLAVYQQLKTARADKVQAAGKAEEGDQAMAAGNSRAGRFALSRSRLIRSG